jgi:hypothetical protein
MTKLEKRVVVDHITVLEDGQLQVRTATRILEDGVEIGKTYHRKVLEPGEDVAKEDDRVLAISQAVWTEKVIDAYIESKAKAEKEREQSEGI